MVAASLAVGGAVLVVVLGTFAVVAIRGRIDADLAMRRAQRAGWSLMLLGLASGVVMIARGATLQASGHLQEAYERAGFLKDLHGVTLHAVLVLPMLAWLLGRAGVNEERRVRYVGLAIAAYLVLVVAALVRGVLSF